MFESSVNSYDSQTRGVYMLLRRQFESSVNSYDSQTDGIKDMFTSGLRVV